MGTNRIPAYPLFWEPLSLHACTEGVLYWTAYDYERCQRALISFYLGDEVFKETPLPDLIKENGYNLSRFALYNGSISWMCCYNHDSMINPSIHLWVMTEDYQWVKQFSIGPISMTIIPLGIWNNGNLIVSGWDSQLFSVDPNTLHMKDLGLQGYQAFVYNESLVSFGCQIAGDNVDSPTVSFVTLGV
ncbi:hypothetical protein RJ639_016425 [Escallonia herrerae]|uniref:F-box associated beta-propeller type 3 domain-containing protein n=1 Tax=Escallonia herrerae TaxID=1293975 RepID=A0AA89ALC5_9ASTE|nr:hypothetical protein RJ639_016425 [Escallonia herrerae]